MAASRDDYELTRTHDSDEEKVLRLLHENPGRAFSAAEVADRIGLTSAEPLVSVTEGFHAEALRDIARGVRETAFRSFLDRLADQGRIEKIRLAAGSMGDPCYSAKV